jgi:retron-type reverse transcriptase
MQTTNTYLGLLCERGKRGLPLRRVYRQLFNKQLYLTAYGKIYRNAGATTKGVNGETVDAMSLEKIDSIIEALRSERYQWQPARRVYILKRNGKKRPLGLPIWSDKLLAEVIRLILNAYYDVQFSDHSHGFREGRGCHTALQEIYHTWGSATWIIEGDISDCFGSLSHELILSTLSEKIQDGRFLHPLTVPEMRHLLGQLIWPPPSSVKLVLAWSWWRRWHRSCASYFHTKRRLEAG